MSKRSLFLSIDPNSLKDIIFEPVQSESDFLAALELLQKVYKKEGLGDQWERLRVTPYHLLPTTTVFVAKHGDKVVGTCSSIGHNDLGIPTDSLKSMVQLPQGWIGEVSSLAIDPDYRRSGQIYFAFCLLMTIYQTEYQQLDHSIISVHPKQARFYKEMIGYEEISLPMTSYSFVQGAPVQVLSNDLSTLHERFEKKYASIEGNKNWLQYLKNPELLNFRLPDKASLINQHSILTPELVYHLTKFLSKEDKLKIEKSPLSILAHLTTSDYHEALQAAGLKIDPELSPRKNKRIRIKVPVRIIGWNNELLAGRTLSISKNGVELKSYKNSYLPGFGTLLIEHQGRKIKIPFQSVSRRKESTVAMIESPPPEWTQIFEESHQSKTLKPRLYAVS